MTPTLPTSPPPASVDAIAEKIAEALKQKENKSADGKEKVKRYDADGENTVQGAKIKG